MKPLSFSTIHKLLGKEVLLLPQHTNYEKMSFYFLLRVIALMDYLRACRLDSVFLLDFTI